MCDVLTVDCPLPSMFYVVQLGPGCAASDCSASEIDGYLCVTVLIVICFAIGYSMSKGVVWQLQNICERYEVGGPKFQ
jgi:hypothetical protein